MNTADTGAMKPSKPDDLNSQGNNQSAQGSIYKILYVPYSN